jgi:hypothetical protein
MDLTSDSLHIEYGPGESVLGRTSVQFGKRRAKSEFANT